MKHLLLSLLLISGFVYGQQTISLPSGKIPLKKYNFNITKIIDQTEQTVTGHFFNNSEITFKNPIKTEFWKLFGHNKNGVTNYILSIDYIEINEKKEGELYMGNVSAGFGLHQYSNDKLVEVCNYKNTIYHALDSNSENNRTNTYERIIKYFLEMAFEDFSIDLQNKSGTQHQAFTKNHKEGVYYSYDDYLKGEADTQFTPDIKKVRENDDKPDYLKVFFLDEGNVLKLYKAWGMVIDGDLYANVNDVFYLVNFDEPDNIYTHCRSHFYIRSAARAASYGGLVGGTIGTMVAIAVTQDKIIDNREARQYPFEKLQFNPKTGALTLNEIANKTIENGFYLYLSPESKINQIDLNINGITTTFYKDNVIKIEANQNGIIEVCHPLIYNKKRCVTLSLSKKNNIKACKIDTNLKGKVKLTTINNDWEVIKIIKQYFRKN